MDLFSHFHCSVVGLGQGWHRYFCQFKKKEHGSKKLRQMKLIPIGHHGLVREEGEVGRGRGVGMEGGRGEGGIELSCGIVQVYYIRVVWHRK